MKKITLSLLSALVFVMFATALAAQVNPPGMKSEGKTLGIEALYVPCEDPTDEYCTPYPTGVAHPDPAHLDHEMGLYGDGLPSNTDIYIVGCIAAATGGTRCTTGSDALDSRLNSYPYGDQMSRDPSHQFKALQNPVKTDAFGVLENVIVRSFTPQSTLHSYMAYYIDPTAAGPDPSATSVPAQHQDDLSFVTPTPRPRPRPPRLNAENDPKGRFFDIKSLEPIPLGEIALLDGTKQLYSEPDLVNPQTVKENGEFNFWVKNGTYYLNVSGPPAGYAWPVQLTDVHPGYSKAYYCDHDVTDENNISVPLYLKQDKITELNKLVHCDLPLDPGTNTPYRSEVKAMEFSVSKEHGSTLTRYGGKVTHPLTVVTLQGEETGKQAATTTANKTGFWNVTVENALYPLRADGTPDRLIAYYRKTDLTGSTSPTSVAGNGFEPILNYVEGYAYDSAGKPLPQAGVGFRQQATDRIVYVTTSDNTGYFKIPTRYLPTFGYELVFLASGTTEPTFMTTSTFTAKNAPYLTRKGINLLTGRNDEFINPKTVPSQPATRQSAGTVPTLQMEETADKKPSSNMVLLVLSIVFLSVAGVGTVAFLLYKKNRSKDQPEL